MSRKAKKRSRQHRANATREDYHPSFSLPTQTLAAGLCKSTAQSSVLRSIYPSKHAAPLNSCKVA